MRNIARWLNSQYPIYGIKKFTLFTKFKPLTNLLISPYSMKKNANLKKISWSRACAKKKNSTNHNRLLRTKDTMHHLLEPFFLALQNFHTFLSLLIFYHSTSINSLTTFFPRTFFPKPDWQSVNRCFLIVALQITSSMSQLILREDVWTCIHDEILVAFQSGLNIPAAKACTPAHYAPTLHRNMFSVSDTLCVQCITDYASARD